MPKSITVKTPSGAAIILTFAGVELHIDVPDKSVSGTVNSTVYKASFIGNHPEFGRVVGVKVNIFKGERERTPVAIHSDDVDSVNAMITIWQAARSTARKAKMDENIPGHTELTKAYLDRVYAFNAYDTYTARGQATSIFSGDNGDVKGAEAKVTELELQYPIAKAYIEYKGCSPETSMGRQAKLAAKALYSGASLDEAKAIADDYNHWD